MAVLFGGSHPARAYDLAVYDGDHGAVVRQRAETLESRAALWIVVYDATRYLAFEIVWHINRLIQEVFE